MCYQKAEHNVSLGADVKSALFLEKLFDIEVYGQR